MTRYNSLFGRIPSSADNHAAGILAKSALLYRAPVLPSKTEAFKSTGRGRFRKMAFTAFGRRQSHRVWHAGPVDSLGTIFHAWRWGRKQPGPADLVFPIYTSPQVRLMIFLLDVSDSMSETLDLTRLWLEKSMGEAYFRRDPVAIITVQGAGAKLLVHPTTSVHFVLHRLTSVIVGGATPLDQGLLMVGRMIRQWQDRYPIIDLIVLSDGRSTSSLVGPRVSASLVIIKKFVRRAAVINPIPAADRFAQALASLLGAKLHTQNHSGL